VKLEVLWEDNHCLAVTKPAGLPSQGDESEDDSLVDVVKAYLKQTYNKPGNVYLGLLHRLDRPVSGVVLLAKTSKAAQRLSKQFRDGLVEKTYWAVVEGVVDPTAGVMVDYVWKDRQRNLVSIVDESSPGAKDSRLDYRLLHEGFDSSLVEVRLASGRSHQIRVQFAGRGMPIVGDRKYGSTRVLKAGDGGSRIALHARSIRFKHPTSQEERFVEAPAPADWPEAFAEARVQTWTRKQGERPES
jgi:23S rRNA pseudouridine1911/1915/1917 synthase